MAEPSAERLPKYGIERELPGAGKMTPEQLRAVSQTSCGVLRQLGPEIRWVHSYVTDGLAPDEELIREHATKGGFPANQVSAVRTIEVRTIEVRTIEVVTINDH